MKSINYYYKFLSNLKEVCLRYLKENPFPNCRNEYENILNVFNKDKNLFSEVKSFKKLNHVNELVENNFLFVSENYLNKVNKKNSWVLICYNISENFFAFFSRAIDKIGFLERLQ